MNGTRSEVAFDDKATIDELVARFYDAFTNRSGAPPNIDCLSVIFIPEATIVNTVGGATVACDVTHFIEPRRTVLTDGTLLDFREYEISEETQIEGNVAQRLSHYEKSWTASGEAEHGRGVKVIQLVRTRDGWKISSLAWDDEVR